MNLQEYTAQLEARNGTCKCPGLETLYQARSIADTEKSRCDFFQRNVDLDNPKPRDSHFIKEYRDAVQRFMNLSEQYYNQVTRLAKEGKLRLVLHDKRRCRPRFPIRLEDASHLLERESPLITIHCASCNQQIDIAEEAGN